MDPTQNMIPWYSNFAMWAIVTSLVLGVFGPYMSNWVIALFGKPKLKLIFSSKCPIIKESIIRAGGTSKVNESQGYEIYLTVIAKRNVVKNLQIKLIGISKKQSNGEYIEIDDFVPVLLEVRYDNNLGINLIPEMEYNFPLGIFYEPEKAKKHLEFFTFKNSLALYDVLFEPHIVRIPHNGHHILSPGDYSVELQVVGENIKPEIKRINFEFGNKWNKDKDNFVKSLIKYEIE